MLKKIICPSVVFMTLLSFSAYGFLGEEKKTEQEILEEVIVTEADLIEEIKQPGEKKEGLACFEEEIEKEKKEEVVLSCCIHDKKEKEDKEPVLI